MSQWPPFSNWRRLPRAFLWIAVFFVIVLTTVGEPILWAAPVTAPRNQTLPPSKTSIYLPAVHRTHSVVDTLKNNGDFGTLLQTLEATDFITALETGGPLTMFAPTDAAFAKLPTGALEQLLASPTGQLTQILLFHIVPGHYELDDLETGMQITTQQGGAIHVERTDDGGARIQGARILTPSLRAGNVVIHAIDTVILPPPQEPSGDPVNAGSCSGADYCKFRLSGGPSFANNGGGEMKLQLFFIHGGLPQGDYRLAVERDGQLISTFADTTSLALIREHGNIGPYNYEAKVQVSNLPGGTLEGNYYFWVLDGNRERDSAIFSLHVPPGQGEIWIQFDQG